jgi:5-oxoprolinase (ATP-hydrolysing)
LQVSIIRERRVYRPYGLNGGEDAECGLNLWVRNVEKTNWEKSLKEFRDPQAVKDEVEQTEYEERYINLGAKNSAAMEAGDRIIVCTPGGGGWGAPGQKSLVKDRADHTGSWKKGSGAIRDDTALQA